MFNSNTIQIKNVEIENNNNIDEEKDSNLGINRNKTCQICKVKESIYTCPRCQINTCCISCVKQHKIKYKCTGIRDKFSKKRIEEFTANDFFRDINFINSTINETNKIEKKLFNLTEENTTELITIKNNIEELNGKTIHKDCKIKIYINF
jgi:hypothetical protein